MFISSDSPLCTPPCEVVTRPLQASKEIIVELIFYILSSLLDILKLVLKRTKFLLNRIFGLINRWYIRMPRPLFTYLMKCLFFIINCGIAGENRPTGAKFPMEIIDL